ncbi:hypothetical protein [Methylomagnum ishizawai]|uniref:hypothetical protein n=1 Tax=Methylomagnum ishizawai TaxID=1760988 RepID=UPI001C3227EF|nr:hypothetical protein [Methylomagnum ishizawai]BBL75607.1 hypothetical protein MishRS11D_27050 [Methylomagnum ishizawai]
MPTQNACIDCLHSIPAMGRHSLEWFCAHPQAERTTVHAALLPCSSFRARDCGAQGTHFKSKLIDRVLDAAE